MLNTGAEPHHAQFMRVNDDATMEQVQAALEQSPEAAFQFVTFQGGPAGVIPGGTSEVYVDLPAGQYLLVCFLPSPDGVPHVAKGMIMPVTVSDSGDSTTTAAMLPTDTTITFDDFAFEMPDTLSAGHHDIEVVNVGQQPHEMSVLKLADGATADDVNAFFMGQTAGPPPFADFGGMQGIMPGATAVLSLNLEPGTYFASCMIPDPASGESHLALGMGQIFTRATSSGVARPAPLFSRRFPSVWHQYCSASLAVACRTKRKGIIDGALRGLRQRLRQGLYDHDG